jgi:cytochrome c-type biogenesis protein
VIDLDAPLALAFTAGMLATVNPCGFAMLPAYLGYFLGLEGQPPDWRTGTTKAVRVGLAVSAGFLVVFIAVGIVLAQLSKSIDSVLPWATIVIGAILAVLGVAIAFGFEPVVNLPKLERGGRERTLASMFVFGVSYAVASISCALPLFSTTIIGTFRRADLASSVAVFVAYALGMTLILLTITISLALAQRSIVRWLRTAMPFITRISGGLLVLAGLYLTHYGWYELQQRDDPVGTSSSVVDRVTGWSDDIAAWVDRTGAARLGLLLALGLAAVLVVVVGTQQRRRS